MRATLWATTAVLLALGCASAGGPGRTSGGNELTRVDLDERHYSNAFQAVEALRPLWLRKRGPASINFDGQVMVYLDGVRMGGVEMLEQISTMEVERMRFYEAVEAQARFGLSNDHGAIAVVSKVSSVRR